MYKGVMKDNYYRLNPSLDHKINMNIVDVKDMTEQYNNWMALPETKKLIDDTVKCLLTPDNYYEKALNNLMKCALTLKYSEYLEQKPTSEQLQKAAVTL
jgi:hypothetical protein